MRRERVLRPAILRRKRASPWLTMLAVAAVAGVLARASIRGPEPSLCERKVKQGEYRHGIDHCLESYARAPDPLYLRWAADAYLRLNDLERAEDLARRLLGGARAADGNRILSNILLRTSRPGAMREAHDHAAAAAEAHKRAGNERGLMTALLALSQAAWKLGNFAAALRAADQALELADRLGPASYQLAAHMARADALRRIGDRTEARAALQRALERATTSCDKAWMYLKSTMLYMESARNASAKGALAQAEKAMRECGDESASRALDHNLAWLLREDEPARALEKLNGIEKADGETLETLLLRGYLAADRGALEEAEGYLERAEATEAPDADWAWEVVQARAELAELRGGWWGELLAEYRYRRAIAMVVELRRDSPGESAHLVSSHRAPYDGLIALLARAGRWRDALAVILELDASDMLRATADVGRAPHRDVLALDPGAPKSARSTPPHAKIDEVLEAWRSRDLVIVIAPARRKIGSGRERAYRLRITGGRVTGEDVGAANEARTLADELFAMPSDTKAARALGRIVVPSDRTDEALDVLAIGVLGKAPLAALRDEDGTLIIGRRPLTRVLALRPGAPRPDAPTEAPIVLADPRADLPSAALEGYFVAHFLGPGARLFGRWAFRAATRERLGAARRAEVLHIAAHVSERGRERELLLADGPVNPGELVRDGIAPRLAVLASCGSAAAQDVEGWGSIAAALLQNGTESVIATDRRIPDAMSLSLMRGFYAQPDWQTEPARALARVQGSLAESRPAEEAQLWAAFTVFRRPPG